MNKLLQTQTAESHDLHCRPDGIFDEEVESGRTGITDRPVEVIASQPIITTPIVRRPSPPSRNSRRQPWHRQPRSRQTQSTQLLANPNRSPRRSAVSLSPYSRTRDSNSKSNSSSARERWD